MTVRNGTPRKTSGGARRPRAEKPHLPFSTLIIVALLSVAALALFSGCSTSSVPDTSLPVSTVTSTVVPQAGASTIPPDQTSASTVEGDVPSTTPTAKVAEIVANRTPEPTPAPGPLEEAVSAVTDAAGVADTTILGLTTDDWINLGISVLMVLLAVLFAAPVLKRVLRRVVKTTSTDLDDSLATAVFPQLRLFVTLIITQLAVLRLDFLGDGMRSFLGDVFFLLYAVILGNALWKLLDVVVDWYGKEVVTRDKDQTDDAKTESVLTMVRRMGRIAIILLSIGLVLEHLGVQITAVAASFGLIVLAFSLAAQDSLADAISGFIIMLDQPFRVGDRVEIQEIGTWGDVVNIGTRTTRIRTRDNRLVIVPNSIIGKHQVVNYTYPDPRYRVQIEIGIGYDADIDEARRIIEDAVGKVEGVLPDKPVDALFLEFGDSAMVFRVRWWIDSYADTRRMFDKVNEAMYKGLSAAGVDLPFTTYDVNVKLDPPDAERLLEMTRED